MQNRQNALTDTNIIIEFIKAEDNAIATISESNYRFLNLLNPRYNLDFLDSVPKLFTISTENGSCKFNTELLINSSSVISNFISNNPNPLQYDLNIIDEFNVLQKFEQLYRGKLVIFDENDRTFYNQIKSALNLNIPDFEIPTDPTLQNDHPISLSLIMNKKTFYQFLQITTPRYYFTISTHKKNYRVNIFGVLSSKVLREELLRNPGLDHYDYDFNDNFNEFNSICDLFNFKEVQIATMSVEILRKISEDLQIDVIWNDLDKYVEEYEKTSEIINEQQTLIEKVDELFDYLFNINERTVSSVKTFILESFWCQTEDNVKELGCYIIQVIRCCFKLHYSICDLIVELNNESNENNDLCILLPFISKILLSCISKNKHLGSFIYLLCKRGLVKSEDVIKRIQSKIDSRLTTKNEVDNLVDWFFPEIISFNKYSIEYLFYQRNEKRKKFFMSFYPDNIDKYSEMLERGEPNNELLLSVRHDDVDTFQLLTADKHIDITSICVPYSIFEDYNENVAMSFLNYAAAHGSIKCFKYLLLNHATVSSASFYYAIFGGNIEIIKIVDQKLSENENKEANSLPNNPQVNNYIFYVMSCHKNDLFEWILNQKFLFKEKLFNELVPISAASGNIYAITEMIDKGYDILLNKKVIEYAAINGFYRSSQILYNIIIQKAGKEKICEFDTNHLGFIRYDMISIFILFTQMATQEQIELALADAVKSEFMRIVNYFVDNIEKFKITQKLVSSTLCNAANKTDLFYRLLDTYKSVCPDIINSLNFLEKVLPNACFYGNFEVIKVIVDFYQKEEFIKSDSDDFTSLLLVAILKKSFEICQFFIDRKLPINFETLSVDRKNLSYATVDIFSLLIDNCDPKLKNDFISNFVCSSIQRKNKELFAFLMKLNAPMSDALITAVNTNDLEMVKLVLEYKSDASFINKISQEGTAFYYSVKLNSAPIAKHLLSVEGIDPSISVSDEQNPLRIAFHKVNFEIIEAILDFFGDDIQHHTSELNIISRETVIALSSFTIAYLSFSSQVLNINKIYNRVTDIKYIDPNFVWNNTSLLINASKYDNLEAAKKLLKNEKIDPNLCEEKSGNSPLMIAIDKGNTKIAELIAKHPHLKVNAKNSKNQTALYFAVTKNMVILIDLLLKNPDFAPEENDVCRLFYFSSNKISKIFLKYDFIDVNQVFTNKTDESQEKLKGENGFIIKSQTKLVNAASISDFEFVDMIINHPSFDKEKSDVKQALFVSILRGEVEIFKKLLNLISTEINTYKNEDGESLFDYVLKIKCTSKILSEISNHPLFEWKNYDIVQLFTQYFDKLTPEIPIDLLTFLINYDREHDNLIDLKKLLPTGKSFFTSLFSDLNNFKETVNFLLNYGADPNLPDVEQVYPLEYAIRVNSLEFVSALIDSNKIDFSQKVPSKKHYDYTDAKYKTYLHLAAESINTRILNELLKQKVIEINVTDDIGNSPLIEACRNYQIQNIEKLFEFDNLDFLHRNKEGKDALAVMKGQNAPENVEDKNEYLKLLLSSSSCFPNMTYVFNINGKSNNELKFEKKKFSFGSNNGWPSHDST